MTSPRTDSGRAPEPSTASWKPRTSKPSPSSSAAADAEPLDLEASGHVGERLRRVGDVPIHLGRHVYRCHRRVLQHVVDRLLARPPERMESGVDHESRRPPHVGREHAHPLELRRVQAHLVGQPFRVQAPALGVGVEEGQAADGREVGKLERQGELEVMARNGLVEGNRLEVERGALRRLVDVRVVGARAGTVQGRRHVVRGRGSLRLQLGDRLEGAHRLGQSAEPVDRDRLCAPDCGLGSVEDLLRAAPPQRRIGLEPVEDRPHVGGAEQLRPQGLELLVDARHHGHAGRVQVLGCAVGGGVHAHEPPVSLQSARQVHEPGLVIRAGGGQHVRDQGAAVRLERRTHLAVEHVRHAVAPRRGAVPVGRRLDGQRTG